MRLTPSQEQITQSTVDRVLGAENRVWLFAYRDNGIAVNQSELLRMRDHMITCGPDGA